MKTVSIVGVGRMGGALAIALSRSGFAVDRLIFRSAPPSPQLLASVSGDASVIRFDQAEAVASDIVLITTADTEIETAAAAISVGIKAGTVVLHTSGALSSEILDSIADTGVATGSMHPLVSVSDTFHGAESFAGAYFCVEGKPAAVSVAENIVGALGGKSFSIDTRYKPLYHASAVMASGHLTALIVAAAETLSRCGVERAEAKDILLPLVESTVHNLSRQNFQKALTGPFARRDVAAVKRHLDAFDNAGLADEKKIYLELGLTALRLAEINGVESDYVERIRAAIKLAQGSAK